MSNENKLPDQKETVRKLIVAQRSFRDFVYEIFSASFDKFIGGKYIDEVCDLYDSCQHTARIAPRDHFKSTGLYAEIMYNLLFWKGDLECHYFSYQESMAGYHIGKIKNLIAKNPYFDHLTDLSKGESKIRYQKSDGSVFRVEPHGLLAFKRGIHAPRIYVDDPFQDPENKLLPTIIKKINDVFVTQIMDMVTQDGRLHVVGTPQTPHDFFFNQKVMQEFAVMIKPAVLSYVKKEALWPEHMNFEELMKRKEIRGEKIFNQEYMCVEKGTKIITKGGFKRIEDIEEGELVLGNGKFVNVKRKFITNADRLIRLGMDAKKELCLTPNHPVLVIKQKGKKEGYKGFYHIPTKRGFEKEWKNAGEIERGDIICFPRHKESARKNINMDALKLAGWYVSEGFSNDYFRVDSHSWMMGIAKKQPEIRKEIRELIRNVWEYEANESKKEVIVCLGRICRYYHYFFGGNAYDKCLPEWFFDLTKKQFFAFFETLFNGDGHYEKGRGCSVYTTVSETLAIQLKCLLRKFGVKARMTKSKNTFNVSFSDNSHYVWTDDEYYYERILEVSEKNGKFETFNLQTSDGTYCTEHLLVHNCSPVWSEDSFFKEDQLIKVINSDLQNLSVYDKIKTFNTVVAGFDIGKKSHPSHLAVFELRGGFAIQLHSKFMDGWNYAGDGTFNPEKPTQVEYLLMAIDNFKIDRLFYDDTRAEFESLRERGILPGQCEPVVFSVKEKHSMAVEFDKSVTQKKIQLLDDHRQTEQILMVTNDLKALETPSGHGDSFWSIALAHKGINPEYGKLSDIYDDLKDSEEKPVTAGLQNKVF